MRVNQQCCLQYDIDPFQDAVLFDVGLLDVFEFLLG